MLVAISGSQGSGKSTLLAQLADRGYNVIQRKTSRSILNDWGVTLSQVNNDHELTTKFQMEITQRKYDDELQASDSDQLWFTERTHADLFTYAVISLGKDNRYSKWIDQYYHTCHQANCVYQHVIYLKAGLFDVEHDDVRGSNPHYSTMVDVTMDTFTKHMIPLDRLTTVDVADMEQRVSAVLRVI